MMINHSLSVFRSFEDTNSSRNRRFHRQASRESSHSFPSLPDRISEAKIFRQRPRRSHRPNSGIAPEPCCRGSVSSGCALGSLAFMCNLKRVMRISWAHPCGAIMGNASAKATRAWPTTGFSGTRRLIGCSTVSAPRPGGQTGPVRHPAEDYKNQPGRSGRRVWAAARLAETLPQLRPALGSAPRGPNNPHWDSHANTTAKANSSPRRWSCSSALR